jgi:PTH1 family peptidyl-tRNA hydrolase
MKLIVGLGNPGPEYQKTRHNAGFLAVDRFVQRHALDGPRSKFHAGLWEGAVFLQGKGHRVLVMQPMTYMNRSGLSVGEAVAFYKLQPADVMVLVDDLALESGVIRLRASGGAGGHNGLKDIQRSLGTQDYPRLRIGIDSKGLSNQVDYVLGRFTEEQLAAVQPALVRSCEAIECWLSEGIEKAMTSFNPAP